MSKIRVYDIDWDTDDDEIIREELPEEILLNTEYLDVENEEDIYELEDVISDYLSDEYGYCHKGFNFERIGYG